MKHESWIIRKFSAVKLLGLGSYLYQFLGKGLGKRYRRRFRRWECIVWTISLIEKSEPELMWILYYVDDGRSAFSARCIGLMTRIVEWYGQLCHCGGSIWKKCVLGWASSDNEKNVSYIEHFLEWNMWNWTEHIWMFHGLGIRWMVKTRGIGADLQEGGK